jgi:LmbE family N-acetylglucosaminyl deacetylase
LGVKLAVAAGIAWSACTSASAAGILVVAPHPDDDIITSAGVVFDAIRRGEQVTVVYATNGDFDGPGVGALRQNEAVAAQTQFLGTIESELVFLGYPDGSLKNIYENYDEAGDQFATSYGVNATYGSRGLGGADYHMYKFGTHAAYNRVNMVGDMKAVLQQFRPDQIFTTAQYDDHSDHATTYNIVRDALLQIFATDLTYKPVLNKTVVWSHCCDGDWPLPPNAAAYHTPLPDIPTVPLVWANRESLDVPSPMRATTLVDNVKYNSIQAHMSQADGGQYSFIARFVKKDEFFWPENLRNTNAPPVVNAGTDQNAQPDTLVSLNGGGSFDPVGLPLTYTWTQAEGPTVALTGAATATPSFTAPTVSQSTILAFRLKVSDGEYSSPTDLVHITVSGSSSASDIAGLATVTSSSDNPGDEQTDDKAVDGCIDGYPGDYRCEWATQGQGAGAWIQLNWSSASTVSSIVLHDRPNANDQILGGTLLFSDGSTVTVGTLPNNGSGLTVDFSPRSITSVRFQVGSVSGTTENVGLSEIEVFGSVSAPTPPAAPSGLAAAAFSSSQINLTWNDNATNESGFNIDRSTNGGSTWTTIATLGANTVAYSNTGLTASTTYTYRVRAFNGAANSAYTSNASATTPAAPTAPVAASGLTATAASYQQVNLAWVDNANNETSYRVERSTNGVTYSLVTTLGANATSYQNTGLSALTLYFYRVIAVNAVGSSPSSNVASVLTPAAPPPPVSPSGLTATVVSSAQINLAWVDNATTETGYRVERAVGAGAYSTIATLGANVTSYQNSSLAGSTTYSYRVMALGSPSNSGYSNVATATTTAAPASVNISNLATITASSDNPPDNQQANKVADGFIDGYPGDYTREWATQGQGVGAWVKLTWSIPYVVDKVVIYDRPNLNDQVLAATINFSDGSSVTVPALTNNGAAVTVTFTPRSVTSVTFNVTQVAGTTENIGLSELQVFGQ